MLHKHFLVFEHDKFPLKEDIFVEDPSQAMVTKYGTLAPAANKRASQNRLHFWGQTVNIQN